MTVLTNDDYDNNIKNGIVLIDFFADWCGPCHALSPVIEELEKKYEGKVSMYKLDVDASPQIAARYQIMSIPTVLIFKNGQLGTTVIGAQPESRYVDALEEQLK